MYRPVLVTPPAIKPVTLTEVKAALDIGYTAKDDLLNGLIDAATSYLDGWTGILGRCLVEQTWRQDFNDFRSCLRLPLFPVISVSSVKYTDTVGAEQTIAAPDYSLRNDDLGAYVEFVSTYSFPALNAEGSSVRAQYVAGYANGGTVPSLTSTVPAAIKQAMFLMIRQWFDNPSNAVVGVTVASMPMAVDALLAPYRRIRF